MSRATAAAGARGGADAGADPGAGATGARGREPVPPTLAERHLLSLRTLPHDDWQALLAAAERLAGPEGRRPLLAGRRLGMLFFDASLRTRTAFEVACFDLGAHAVPLEVGRGVWKLEHRRGVPMDGEAAEHVREAIPVLGRMLDGLGVRVFAGLREASVDAAEPLLTAIAEASTVPVLNLESAMDHPHQGLADALALRRRLPGRKARIVLSWAPHVKPLPMAVPHAALLAFAREGHSVALAHPPGYELDEGVLADARAFAAQAGGSVEVGHDRAAALAGAEVVYLKSWGARGHYGDAAAAAEAFSLHRGWRLDRAALGAALFMHCLPVRRGVVVADEVLDSPASLVLDQAGARLDVQKATLCRAFGVQP